MKGSVGVVGGGLMVLGAVYFLLSLLRTLTRAKGTLKGKVVLITGASSGLGEACAKAFWRQGCRLILAGRSIERLKAVKDALIASKTEKGCGVKSDEEPAVVRLDLEDLASLPDAAQHALEAFGGVDILISNAGISYRGQVLHTEMDVHRRLMTVNYFGHLALIKALLPTMLQQKDGHIVGISSIQGKLSIPYRSAYSSSKHALQALFDCMRAELCDSRVKFTLISPGYIRTQLSANAIHSDGSRHGVTDATTASGMAPEAVAARVVRAVEQGEPEVTLAPIHHRAAIALRTLMPSLYFSLMAKRARSQRKDYAKMD